MGKVTLDLKYGTLIILNLSSTWIQPMTMRPGYMLCYEDDKYKRGIIHKSKNKNYLIQMQDKLINELSKGEKLIKLL